MTHKKSVREPQVLNALHLRDGNCDRVKLAKSVIRKLTTKFGLSEIELLDRFCLFEAYADIGTGRLWRERFAISRADARRLARRLRDDARDLRVAISPKSSPSIGGAAPSSIASLCDQMNVAAGIIERSLRETTDRAADWTFEPKKELTQFVWRKTGRPLDRELSELISAILNLDGYTAEEQRKFRERCTLDGVDSIL